MTTAKARKLPRKFYERTLYELQGELVMMQEWVKATGARIVVVFEGRDAAGKGSTIKRVTRAFGLETPSKPPPAAVLEIASTQILDGELVSYQIDPSLVVCDVPIRDIPFPEGASVALVVRGTSLVAAKGGTVLRAGDHVYVFVRPQDLPLMALLFGQAEGGM